MMKNKYTNNEATSRMRLHRCVGIMLYSLIIAGMFVIPRVEYRSGTVDQIPNEEPACTTYVEPTSTTTDLVTLTKPSTTTLSTSTSTQTTVPKTSSTVVTSTNVTQPMQSSVEKTTTAIMTSTENTEPDVVITETTGLPITEAERIMLCNLVGHEYGSDWVPVYEKAKVVAVAMNRLHNGYWGCTLYSVLTWPGQFTGFINYGAGGYTYQVTPSVIEAVNYYFAHTEEFDNWLYFDGGHYAEDGSGPYNYFYY